MTKVARERSKWSKNTNKYLNLNIVERNIFIKELKERGLPIRQIARVNGVSKGIVEKI